VCSLKEAVKITREYGEEKDSTSTMNKILFVMKIIKINAIRP